MILLVCFFYTFACTFVKVTYSVCFFTLSPFWKKKKKNTRIYKQTIVHHKAPSTLNLGSLSVSRVMPTMFYVTHRASGDLLISDQQQGEKT